MSVTLDRHAVLETFQLESNAEADDQGMPSYDSPVELRGRVVREDAVVRLANGQEVQSAVTIWIPGTEDPLPTTDDRITLGSDEFLGIVIERTDGKTLQGVLDHVRVRLREE